MKIIVWLWNPWPLYKETRHNLWFIFLDKFKEKNNFSDWKYESKFTAEISKGIKNDKKIVLLKPQTFMNLSWESLQKICSFYKLTAKDFSVVYDDKDMDFWKIRVREKGSAWGHNGIKSIIKYFWEDWKRIKVWVWKTPDKYITADWVLSKFSQEELIDIDTSIYDSLEEKVIENI